MAVLLGLRVNFHSGSLPLQGSGQLPLFPFLSDNGDDKSR